MRRAALLLTEIETMAIYLVRHGETAMNAARVLQMPDTPLSERGRAQAALVASRLAGLRGARMLTSDYARALQTAEPISAALGVEPRVTPLLRERHFGEWRGKAYDTLGFDPLTVDVAPPGGESIEQFGRRVADAFALVIAESREHDGDLIVVSHGLVIRGILERHALCSDASGVPTRMGNTSVTVLDAAHPFRVSLLNCTRHLDERAADDVRSLAGV